MSWGDLSPNGLYYATSGWSGIVKVFNVPSCEEKIRLEGHSNRAHHVWWHPLATISIPETGPNLVTASADFTVWLWNLVNSKNIVLKGHTDWVNYAEFHPIGHLIASSSHDMSWKLWDMNKRKEIQDQEGHVAAVYPLTFHVDGSILSSGDLNGVVQCWDLRTGKSLCSYVAHKWICLSLKWHPNGYHLFSGGDDN